MPRKARAKSSTGIYHVTMRGHNRENLFSDSIDYTYFVSLLQKVQKKTGCHIYAACLMSNHLHILVWIKEGTIGDFAFRLSCPYACYFNNRYDRSGHVFEKRFYSSPVEDMAYFYTCLNYIINNPVEAGIVTSPEQYKWLWCSKKLNL